MLHVQYTHHGPRTISFISPPACLYVLVTMGQFHQLSWEDLFFWIASSHITITHTPSIVMTSLTNWRRKWQPTPLFLPGESHGERSLVGYSPWGRKELDTTE